MNPYDDLMDQLGFWPMRDVLIEPAEKDFQAFESLIGSPLPADYRTFLAKYGVIGFPEPVTFSYSATAKNKAGRSLVSVFYGFDPKGQCSLQTVRGRYNARLRPEYVPVAEDPGGNILVLQVRGPQTGRVGVYLHDRQGDDLAEIGTENLALVADSFDLFMRGLKPLEESA